MEAGRAGWPTALWLVRHGESAGNVARDAAESSGATRIDIAGRDVDVALSALGERQARAVGVWFMRQPPKERPTIVLSSPYKRAAATARLIIEAAQLEQARYFSDERLREKEFGSLNRLTRAGIVATFPEEARLRAELGKFYYRPPGGESWCDVILRLRSLIEELQIRHAGERVLIVTHQVVVLCFRYLMEDLDEERLLAIDRAGDVANCAITSFHAETGMETRRMALRDYNLVEPVADAGEPVTSVPDLAVKK